MAKRKKPTLKSNANRGFATSSTPSKKEQDNKQSSSTSEQVSETNDSKIALDSYDSVNQDDIAPTATFKSEYFDPQKEEEQALQNLVQKVQEKVEKDVSRQIKVIEFDRRFSKSLPTYKMDEALRDQVLELSASLQPTAPLKDKTTDVETGSLVGSSLQLQSSVPFPSISGSTLTGSTTPLNFNSGSTTPLGLGSGRDTIAMSSLSKHLKNLSVSNAASALSSAFADSEEKVMARSITTYHLLLKLGFTPANAESALAGCKSPDVEDCLSYLFQTLDADTLQDCLRVGEGKSVKNRKREEKEPVQDVEQQQDLEEYDESTPPVYQGYGFSRCETVGQTQFSFDDFATSSLNSTTEPAHAPDTSTLAAAVSPDVIDKLKDAFARDLTALLDSDQVDTLQKPSATWSLMRLVQIRIEKEKSKWKKELGPKSLTLINKEEGRLERILGQTKDLMRECERMRGFDKSQASQRFTALLKKREQEEKITREKEKEEKKAQEQRKNEIEAALSGVPSNSTENDKTSTSSPDLNSASGSAEPTQENAPQLPKLQEVNEDNTNVDDEADQSDQQSEGGFFGDLLDEQPTQAQAANSGVIINLRTLPAQAKSGGGGKTPRVLLSDSLKRADAYASYKFEPISASKRLFQSKLTIRWNGGKVVPNKRRTNANAAAPIYIDVYKLTTVACASQLQADDFIATVALFCIEKDKPVQRSLPPGYREWWDELEALCQDERDTKNRALFQRVREVIKVRIQEATVAKKTKAKSTTTTAADPGYIDVGELAKGSAHSLSAEKAREISERFTQRKSSTSYQAMLPGRQNLPIAKYRQEILDLVANNQIFVLSGETGCGKSTQVPAYILEHCMSKGENCKIYVTEPRRISAISLAERVSEELGEPKKSVGGDRSLVGYAIRLESHVGKNARLIYATTGIVLRMLEGTAFNEITHVIIDEVHERSIESDFLLIILKTLLAHRQDLKVILMSATVDAERISDYCGGCPTITVPGRTFPVDVYYLEDAIELSDYTVQDDSPYLKRLKRGQAVKKTEAPRNMSKLQVVEQEDDEAPLEDDEDDDEQGPETGIATKGEHSDKIYRKKTVDTLERMNEYVINHDLIVMILNRLCFEKDLQQFSAATLIFLPGLADIRKCYDMLNDHPIFGGPTFRLFPLHSSISSENQGAVFGIPPAGVRKIVIATNIAETGITIPDITCVIDCGKHREMRYDEKRQLSRLVECFIAKSNAKQRRGRAGRVQHGICFHLFTKLRHDSYLGEHPLPEMLRLSLQDLALKLKVMKIKIGTSIENALSQALDPPTNINIQRAISALVEVKALTTLEEITPLGRHLSRLPLDVHMGKFLLVATLFKCLDPALTIAAALNSKTPFVAPFGKEAEANAIKQSFKIGDSDFLTIANAFNGFRRSTAANHHYSFCKKNYLSFQNLTQIEELRQQYFSYLIDAGFVTVDQAGMQELSRLRYRSGGGDNKKLRRPQFMSVPAELNVYSTSLTMIHAALATGLYPKLIHIDPKSYQLKTISNNQPTSIHPSSINFKVRLSEFIRGNSSYLLYFTIMQRKRLYALETGVLDDKAVFMLCGEADFKLSSNSLYIDRQKIRIGIPDPKDLVALKILREQMSKLMNAAYRNPRKQWSSEQNQFFDLACQVLGVGANDKDAILPL